MKRVSKRGQQNMRSNYHDPNDRPMNNLPDNFRNLPECTRCKTTRDTVDGDGQSHGFGSWRLGAPGNCGPCCGGRNSPGPRVCYPGVQGGIPIDKQANKIANINRRTQSNISYGQARYLPEHGIDVQPVLNSGRNIGDCTQECRSRDYLDNGQPGPWGAPYPSGRNCSDCCNGGGVLRTCKPGTFNQAKEAVSRQSKGVAQSVGKITTLPRLGIQVQGVNERPGIGPCTTMCRSRRVSDGVEGPWSGSYPAASDPHCGDCCGSAGGGARLGRKAQQVCQKGSHNVAVAMAPGMKAQGRMNFRGGGFSMPSGEDTFFRAQGQDDCDPPQVMVNGVCVDEGLGGDPARQKGCPRGQYRDRNGNCRSMQPGTYNAKTKRPPINPFAPTTLPYDPMGAKQIANPGCNPPCGKGEYCQGGQCYSGQPFARQKIISRRRR